MSKQKAGISNVLIGMALALAGVAQAVPPPRTLNYQGELRTSGGSPVNGAQSIVFSLYDVASGGSALWTETDSVVVVDGRFQAELGDGNAIPEELLNRQLWLGVRVGSDSEMTPRTKLAAAPYAVRALQTMHNELRVPAEASASENGLALLAAMTVASAAGGNPFVVRLDAGTYDLGNQALVLPRGTVLQGAGKLNTTVRSTADSATVHMQSFSELADVLVFNNGAPAGNAPGGAVLVINNDSSRAEQVRISDANLWADAPGAASERKVGLLICNAQAVTIRNSYLRASGGNHARGLSVECLPLATNVQLFEVEVAADGGNTTTIGAEIIANFSLVRGLVARATPSASAAQTQLMGVFVRDSESAGRFEDVLVNAQSSTSTALPLARIFGFAIHRVQNIEIDDGQVASSGRAYAISGLDLFEVDNALVNDVQVFVSGTAAANMSESFPVVQGIAAGDSQLDLHDSHVSVGCLADNELYCNALNRGVSPARQNVGLWVRNSLLQVFAGQALTMGSEDPSLTTVLTGAGPISVLHSTLEQNSANGWALNPYTNGGAVTTHLTASHSRLVSTAAAAGPACLGASIGGDANYTFFIAHTQLIGGICNGTGTCSATTNRGFGFNPETCPPGNL
ncbi:hypothetical protein [Pseudomarimonas arenosa]|uniref:Uncharacterized protein n=1 Tax=Pseudomarimonas arenosa TaxID=2774145 RepID=A0AAW3ZMG2_9GAMM|nr:hypothetical protein [Pseudomarimonas arenosa]MBD8526090.1 hypothetical protein [Pseudomarimonas arenosa]